jgi:hypothetical protein
MVREQGAAGSNPVIPTSIYKERPSRGRSFLSYKTCIVLGYSNWQKCQILTDPALQEKAPQPGGRLWGNGRFLEVMKKNLRPACHSRPSMVYILPILSGMSTEKFKYKGHQGTNPGGHSFVD